MKMVKIIYARHPLKFNYFITDTGKVYSEITKRYLKTCLDKDGYEKVTLVALDGRHRFSVHRLVLENFNPQKDMNKLQVNHIDGDKQNNNLSNLEWVTNSENIIHAYKMGLKSQCGAKNNASKLNEDQVKEIINLLLMHKFTYKQIAKYFNVDEETIGAIKRKKNWKYLTESINF